MPSSSDDGDGKGKVIKTALEPMAREFAEASTGTGQALGNVVRIGAKSVEAVFQTLFGPLVWGYAQMEEWLALDVEKELESVPLERRIEPRLSVAGPAVQAMVFIGHEPELRAMFTKLLATSMDAETAEQVHPAFVEIIKQLVPDEARILRYFRQYDEIPMIDIRVHPKNRPVHESFEVAHSNVTTLGEDAGCEIIRLVPTYIDNLMRLELCRTGGHETSIAVPGAYDRLEHNPDVQDFIKSVAEDQKTAVVHRQLLQVTHFGGQFIRACIR